jgi:hypothetical protein
LQRAPWVEACVESERAWASGARGRMRAESISPAAP